MSKKRFPQIGDVYWISPNFTSGREMKGPHRFIVITTERVNRLGVSITVPVTTGGSFARDNGISIPISGYDTTGVAVCNQVRSFDIESCLKDGAAKYIETLDRWLVDEIISRVISIIDPSELS